MIHSIDFFKVLSEELINHNNRKKITNRDKSFISYGYALILNTYLENKDNVELGNIFFDLSNKLSINIMKKNQ